jgi:Rrf2 family protein
LCNYQVFNNAPMGAKTVLSNTAEYALRIMITLTEAADDPLTAERIAGTTRVPADYAVKVLQWLGRARMVHGQRGRKGGFRLACDPRKTTLLDVVNVIDPLERIPSCPLGREAHQSALCPLHTRLDDVVAVLIDTLGGMTLQSVVDGTEGPALCQPGAVSLPTSTDESAPNPQ